MKLELDKIVKLNNEEKYIVLNYINDEGNDYFLTMGIIGDNEIDSSRVIVFKQAQDDQGFFVEKVIDSELLLKLTKLFKEQM